MIVPAVAAALTLVSFVDESTDSLNFATEVRPILARRCFACHGNDEETQEAGLRLDSFEEATKDRDGFPALVPGDPEESELFVRITDEFDPMPPEHAGEALSPEEVATLRRWIEGGAEYAPHWSFVAPTRPDVPAPPAEGGDSPSAIDGFVDARLRSLGLVRSPVADDYTLLRRLSLDLTGLPPTPEAARAFAASTDGGKYEAAVDRLLASPDYAERWAAVWLDLARYADSSGHGSDPLRTIWRYRDWVIEAFDRNMPFDEFTVHQLAGDLLGDADRDSRLATAFHRNTMTNTEGGTDDEEFRVLAVKDRVNTTMQVWMGLTAGCAECHSHKYDPISHVEYYRLFDLFNQTADADRNNDAPRMDTPTRDQAGPYDALTDRLDALEGVLADPLGFWSEADRMGAEARLRAQAEDHVRWRSVGGARAFSDPVRWSAEAGGESLTALRLSVESLAVDGGAEEEEGAGVPAEHGLTLWMQSDAAEPIAASAVRIVLPGQRRILSLAEVELVDADGRGIAGAFAAATQSSTDYGAVAARAIDGRTDGEFASESVTHTSTETEPWWEGRLADNVGADGVFGVRIWSRTDGDLESRLEGLEVVLLDGEGQESWRSGPAPAPRGDGPRGAGSASAGALLIGPVHGQPLVLEPVEAALAAGQRIYRLTGEARGGAGYVAVLESPASSAEGTWSLEATADSELPLFLGAAATTGLRKQASLRSAEEEAAILGALMAHDPKIAEIEQERATVAAERKALGVPTTPVMVERGADQRRKSHVLVRGNFLQKGEQVTAAVPAVFPPLPDGVEPDRLALAKWLVSDSNPLSARVAVNRLWSRLFGRGLVLSEGDFGSQAELPTHPQLLDWLAVEFRESGWDQKHLLKTLVMSRTYRQSSDVRGSSAELDPTGQWLSRYPRQRLEAEMVRDYSLAVSGLLSRKRFGPSVYPPQPEGLWKAAFNGQRDWKESEGEDRYRRGVYVFLRRTIPYPMLATFDAPSRENCTVQRIPTNTPLQAFVTLNDPVFVEASQALARLALGAAAGAGEAGLVETETAATGVVEAMLWQVLGRPPVDGQVEVLQDLYSDAALGFAEDPEAAAAFAMGATAEMNSNSTVGDAEMAAWTLVASAALNLDRALTKE